MPNIIAAEIVPLQTIHTQGNHLVACLCTRHPSQTSQEKGKKSISVGIAYKCIMNTKEEPFFFNDNMIENKFREKSLIYLVM